MKFLALQFKSKWLCCCKTFYFHSQQILKLL